jgi:catechol 2,3-dioxygenase-like lactoylglutathione lyase family enzyme
MGSSQTFDRRGPEMLLDGINHVALLTADTKAFHAFFEDVFDATITHDDDQGDFRVSMVHVGSFSELNVFQIAGNTEAERQTPMFGRGRLDHIGLQAASFESFGLIRQRLMTRGATDGFVTDFGPVLSVYFVGPDGLEGEVCVRNPDAQPGAFNPPGTASTRFSQ